MAEDKKKSFLSLFEELLHAEQHQHGRNGHAYAQEEHEPFEAIEFEGDSVLTDEVDHQILMHRDAHFGGDFQVMMNYYSNEDSVGVHPDFDPERIAYLADVENGLGEDLAPLILNAHEAELVGRSRRIYSQLREIYDQDEPAPTKARLIADLILTEEEEPEREIEAIVSQGTDILPELFVLLQADELYDPLFPGYGYAPYLAIECIGKIQDPSGIAPIFSTLSRQVDYDENVVLDAFADIGEPAKEFLIKTLKSRPLTHDNSHAAFALSAFSHDPQVAIACFEQLKDPEVQDKPLLRTYILNNCDSLKNTPYRADFTQLANDPHIPTDLRSAMQTLIEEWNQ